MSILELFKTDEKNLRWIEGLNVVLWMVKDMSWISSWHWLATTATVFTLLIAVKIAWASRRMLPDLVRNVAVCLWICANVSFSSRILVFDDDELRPHTMVFFYVGLGMMLGYYAWAIFQRLKVRAEKLADDGVGSKDG